MQENTDKQEKASSGNAPADLSKKQQQTDPQMTELKGFLDPKEDLEPDLHDGTKSPEKAKEEFKQDKHSKKS